MVATACTVRPIENSEDSATTAATSHASTTTPVAASSSGDSPDPTTDPTADPTSGTGCPFICPPDLGPIDDNTCAPTQQDCPDGEKCVWYVAPGNQLRREAARCIPVTGDRAPFEPCNLPTGFGSEISDDCGADSYCLEVYETADHGFCAPFLHLEDQIWTCDHLPGTQVAVENGSDFPAACLFSECNPLDPSTCPADMTCTFYPAWIYGANHCWHLPPDELPLGAACDPGECGPGKLCLVGEAVPGCAHERCCTAWCDLDAPTCADPAAQCQLFPVGFPALGACLMPGWEWG